MKLNLDRDVLIKPLGQISNIVERRQTLPILANVHLKKTGDSLVLTGTDLEVEVRCQLDGVDGDEGETTVTAKKLFDICRSLPENAKLAIKTKGELMDITSGNSHFSLQTRSASEFPHLETLKWDETLSVEQAKFRKLIEQTSFSMANQDVRYYLNGLLLERGNGVLRAVATDGHRLAMSELDISTKGKKEKQAIVPRKAVIELGRLLADKEDKVAITFNENHMQAQVDNITFTSKLIDGRFPDYKAVMAPELDKKVSVNRAELLDMLTRTAILTNEKYRGIRINVSKGLIQVSASNPEKEEASDEMNATYAEEALEIGFNVGYLIDALRALPGEEVILSLKDPDSSCTMNEPEQERTIYLIMPMRLDRRDNARDSGSKKADVPVGADAPAREEATPLHS